MEGAYFLTYHPRVAKEDIPKMDRESMRRVKEAIEQKLTTHPDIFGVPLRRSLKGHRKLRVGDYRIIFRIEKKTIFILAIMPRSIVYKRFQER